MVHGCMVSAWSTGTVDSTSSWICLYWNQTCAVSVAEFRLEVNCEKKMKKSVTPPLCKFKARFSLVGEYYYLYRVEFCGVSFDVFHWEVNCEKVWLFHSVQPQLILQAAEYICTELSHVLSVSLCFAGKWIVKKYDFSMVYSHCWFCNKLSKDVNRVQSRAMWLFHSEANCEKVWLFHGVQARLIL